MKPDLNLGDSRLILTECRKQRLELRQAAYVMATAYWETAHTVKPVKEAYWIKNAEAWREKNLRYWPWYGRGYAQLTWKDNYIKAGKELDLDLITDPDVVMEPATSAKILVVGSMQGWFTGKKLGDYINSGRVDYRNARRVINGTDKADQIAALAKDYEDALTAGDTYYNIQWQPPKRSWLEILLALFKGVKR